MEIEAQNEGYKRLPNNEDVTLAVNDTEMFNDTNIRHIIENSSNKNKIKLSLSQEQIYPLHAVVYPTAQSNMNHEPLPNQSIALKKSITCKTIAKNSSSITVPLAINEERNRLNNDFNGKKNDFSELSEFSMTENEKSNLLRKYSVSVIGSNHQGQINWFDFKNTKILDKQYKCSICKDAFKDPRVLDCLHSFCFDCLTDVEVATFSKTKCKDLCELDLSSSATSSIEVAQKKESVASRPTTNSQRNKEKKIGKKNTLKPTRGRFSCVPYTENPKTIQCSICFYETEIPNGGLNNLPQNFLLSKKVKEALLKVGMASCGLCYNEAIAFCMTCSVNLCGFCIQAHARQRSTLMHEVRYLTELKNDDPDDEIVTLSVNCTLHPDHELKLFCTVCMQVACSNCSLLLHQGHKCEPVRRACRNYLKLIKDSLSKAKSIKDCANDSISKLNSISRSIADRAEIVQNDVEIFLSEYFKALEVHRKTLLTQISRAKEAKMMSIKDQQTDLFKRAMDLDAVIKFTDELLLHGSEIEILSLFGILLRRYEYCQKSKVPLDSKTSDTLKFLPEVRAPIAKSENNVIIPLYGIITTQIAVPKYCTLESDDLMFLRINRKAEIVMVSRDCYDKQLCHGGLTINVDLKYKDSTKHIPTDVSDKRDGTYIISFIPEIVGNLYLTVAILDKPIKVANVSITYRRKIESWLYFRGARTNFVSVLYVLIPVCFTAVLFVRRMGRKLPNVRVAQKCLVTQAVDMGIQVILVEGIGRAVEVIYKVPNVRQRTLLERDVF
ncbi:Tripartite motif-containing protein 45 [Pseudolycoriella hygida]|uniref:Tripartite motif-containing protein 45 n=1 Tax=Pseudolycoriella hygida TaxID=35572 RepID=A0A9Q0NBW2_9DIPT|nr:Tripartite motif-containing protein 45 [Pseudolycoriella hygida]